MVFINQRVVGGQAIFQTLIIPPLPSVVFRILGLKWRARAPMIHVSRFLLSWTKSHHLTHHQRCYLDDENVSYFHTT